MIISLAILVSFSVAIIVTLAIERGAAAVGMIDVPSDRSSHLVPRPRGGGLAIIAGSACGIFVIGLSPLAFPMELWVVLAGAAAVAAIGAWDDIAPLPSWPRLLVHLAAASLVVSYTGGFTRVPLPWPVDLPLGMLGAPLAVIWIVSVTNFFNFMDGLDGLAAGQACLTFAVVAWAAWPHPIAVVAVFAVAGSAGFLVRNWWPARIFLGDAGTGWLGFLLAALPFAAPAAQREPLTLLAGTSLILFLADPGITVLVRALKGRPLGLAHREHIYQQLIAPPQSHSQVVSFMLLGSATVTAAAAAAFNDSSIGWWSLGWAALVCATEWIIASRVRARRAEPARSVGSSVPSKTG